LLPVEFDLGAAREAVAALRGAADAVDRAARARRADGRDAEEGWDGPQRRVFDGEERRLDGRASELVTELRRLAGEVADTADRVRAENHRRERRLGEWKREQARLREHLIEASRAPGVGAQRHGAGA
jgi:uncharacterized protein YukE